MTTCPPGYTLNGDVLRPRPTTGTGEAPRSGYRGAVTEDPAPAEASSSPRAAGGPSPSSARSGRRWPRGRSGYAPRHHRSRQDLRRLVRRARPRERRSSAPGTTGRRTPPWASSGSRRCAPSRPASARAIKAPLDEHQYGLGDWSVGIRTGDHALGRARAKQDRRYPTALITTPESVLSLMPDPRARRGTKLLACTPSSVDPNGFRAG